MCIIAVKPIGIDMPSMDIIKNCWEGNADGAGIAYWRPGDTEITIDKGFMRLKALKNKIITLNLGRDDLAVLHFRYATHGLKDSGNCHPFPLSPKKIDLRAIVGQFPCAIAHNGVFGNMPCHDTLSDTQKFIGGILANRAIINNIDNIAIQELISGYCGTSSKLAILRPGKLLLIGNFINDKGIEYSNAGYLSSGDWRNDYKTGKDIEWNDKCELCNGMEDIEYESDFQLFMCKKCLEFNLQGFDSDTIIDKGIAHG